MADYETHLARNAANHQPLTPLLFLERAAQVYPDNLAVVHGPVRRTYRDLRERCVRLASALARHGIGRGDTVAAVLPNIPEMLECHYGVPMAGAVLNTINTRLDAATVAYILDHGEAKALVVDKEFMPVVRLALVQATVKPLIIEVDDPLAPAAARQETLGGTGYEALLAEGDPAFAWPMPRDEWDAITLNYTSGTTGNPKGAVYHHRGAYLAGMGNALAWRMQLFPVYLTIVPLFHCNAWCHPWMLPMLGGTLVCCRDITAKAIYDAIADEGVTHFGGAPIVLNMIVNASPEDRRVFGHLVEVFTAGAPPPAATLAAFEPLGFNVTQVYGLTETYGPSTECLWQPDWNGIAGDERADLKSRQGVPMATLEGAEAHDPQGEPVPKDSRHLGEIALRGNLVMKGYYRNPEATAEAFKGGWFRSGDIAIQHPDGYLKITDRAKDIIISGGENVSSVEVEGVLMKHPAISLCAVVAKPDDKWGEVPCAFVELKPGAQATEAELIAHCRAHLAGFKCPKLVVFHELPKTSTGKIQKFELRAVAKLM